MHNRARAESQLVNLLQISAYLTMNMSGNVPYKHFSLENLSGIGNREGRQLQICEHI